MEDDDYKNLPSLSNSEETKNINKILDKQQEGINEFKNKMQNKNKEQKLNEQVIKPEDKLDDPKHLYCLKLDILYNWIKSQHHMDLHAINSVGQSYTLDNVDTFDEALVKMNDYIYKIYKDIMGKNNLKHEVKCKVRSPIQFVATVGKEFLKLPIELQYDNKFFSGRMDNFDFSSTEFFNFIDIWKKFLTKYLKKKYAHKSKLVLVKPPDIILIDYEIKFSPKPV